MPGLADQIRNHPWRARCLVVLVALVARALVVAQLAGGPCLELHRWGQTDNHFFDAWARVVADGDWLTDQALHPHHEWHARVADEATWSRWYGGKRFHQEPLYAYAVAAVYAVGGTALWVLAAQLALGALTLLAVFELTRRWFGEGAAVCAAGLGVLCGTLPFYELLLLRTAPIAAAGLLLAGLFDRALQDDAPRRWFVLGLGCGVAVLLKSTLGLYAVGALAALGWRRGRPGLARRAGALCAGMLLCLAPLVARNCLVGAPALGLSSTGPVTIATMASAGAPTARGWYVTPDHMPRIMHATDGRLLPVVRETLATHSVAGWLTHTGRKLRALWGWYEVPNNANVYYHQLHAPALGWLAVRWWLVAPLALLGLAVARRRRLGLAPLLLLIGVQIAPMVGVYVLARFRAPLLVALLPAAGLGLAALLDGIRGRWIVRSAAAALGVAALVTSSLSVPAPWPTPTRPEDHNAAYVVHWGPERTRLLAADAHAEAADRMEATFAFAPPIVRELETRPARSLQEQGFAHVYAGQYRRHATLLGLAGRVDAAKVAALRAAALARAEADWTGDP